MAELFPLTLLIIAICLFLLCIGLVLGNKRKSIGKGHDETMRKLGIPCFSQQDRKMRSKRKAIKE